MSIDHILFTKKNRPPTICSSCGKSLPPVMLTKKM